MPRPSSSASVAMLPLFPLLAVFLCALGALATLVYGFEREGRVRSIEAAKLAAAAQSQADDLAGEREMLDWRINELRDARARTQEQLADKQRELSHVEDHLRRLRQRADAVRIAAEELERKGRGGSPEADNVAGELERLRRAIAVAEEELTKLERAKRNAPVTYSVVPYEGPNQTKRRPIYIECRLDAVVIQPEGIALRESDFEPPLGPGNPLAASIRAYSEYLQRMGFTGETTRPYPMLLVRPDGIVAYYAARSALESWGTEFGYELIGDDWKLEMPPADARLASGLEQVLAEARLRQEALAMAAPRQFKRPKGALRASPNGRGFVAEGGYERENPYGGSGFADRRSRAGGFGTGDMAGGRGMGSGVEPRGGTGLGSGGRGAGDGLAGTMPNGQVPGYSDGIGADGALPSMPSSDGFAGGPGGRGEYRNPGVAGSTENAAGTFGGTGEGSEFGGGSDARAGGTSADRGSSDARVAEMTRGGAQSGGQPSFGGTAGGQPAGAASGAQRSPTAGQAGGQGQNNLGAMGSPGQGFQADTSQQAGGSGSSRLGGSPGNANSPSAFGSDGAPMDDQPPPASAVAHASSDNRKKSLASKRGQDWGLPDSASHMTPVTRPVIIRCEANQLTIVPDDNRSLPKTIPMKGRTEDSVDPLVSGVWDHMKDWGLAGRGMYWRPTLVMEVAPGAEARFNELQSLLAGSGMEVKARQRK